MTGNVVKSIYNTPIPDNMGSPMKTTIEVSDALFNSAKALAQQSQTTLRAVIEEGLRRVLADSDAVVKPAFKLKDASVHGKKTLISEPRQWQQLEEDHVISRAMKSSS
jgi:hypothetical protein